MLTILLHLYKGNISSNLSNNSEAIASRGAREGGSTMLLTPLFLECQIHEILHKQISLQIVYKLCFKLKKIASESGFRFRLHEKFLQIEHFASDIARKFLFG